MEKKGIELKRAVGTFSAYDNSFLVATMIGGRLIASGLYDLLESTIQIKFYSSVQIINWLSWRQSCYGQTDRFFCNYKRKGSM